MKYFLLYLPLLTLLISIDFYYTDKILQNTVVTNQINDSIYKWIENSRDKNLDPQKRKNYLNRAYFGALKEKNDSLRNTYLVKIAYTYYFKLHDSTMFRQVNKQAMKLSIKLKDSFSLANTYWDLGLFYKRFQIKDSAYFNYVKAQKIFNLLGEFDFSGQLLINMAIIQKDQKDYTGSELSTIKAIRLFLTTNNYFQLYKSYNNLGIIFNEIANYEMALFYHERALEYLEKLSKDSTLKENTLNNIGVVYINKGDYKNAIDHFNIALKSNGLRRKNDGLYARLLDNFAFSNLKMNNLTDTENNLMYALHIRDSIEDYSGIAVSKLHLAEYYARIKDTTKAIKIAKETEKLTTEKNNNDDLLASLLILSKLDKKNGRAYLSKYIEIENELRKLERETRDKFARIRFETDEYIDENVKLNEQKASINKQKNIILIIGSVLLLMGLLVTIIILQRAKNIKLKLEKKQQLANEEIFDLMLVQQYKQDEGRRKEKKRISEELHDGVLSRLFGTRLMLNTLNDKIDNESILDRKKYINELQQVEEEVRNVSHELNERSLSPNIGFIDMVENLLEKQSKISNFNYKTNFDNNIVWEGLKGSFKMNLYRIIQEAIQNIHKYAKANNVLVEFKKEENNLLLIINDDGKGFNPDDKRRGIGINNMKSRVQQLQGKISINSELNNGTAILIETPC